MGVDGSVLEFVFGAELKKPKEIGSFIGVCMPLWQQYIVKKQDNAK